MKKLLTALLLLLALTLPAAASFTEEVNGADYLYQHNGMPDGAALDLSAGGEPGGYWAWAEYCAPASSHASPVFLTVTVENLIGSYWLQTYDWGTGSWSRPVEFSTPVASLPTGSCFWMVHVYGEDSVTVVKGDLLLQ